MEGGNTTTGRKAEVEEVEEEYFKHFLRSFFQLFRLQGFFVAVNVSGVGGRKAFFSVRLALVNTSSSKNVLYTHTPRFPEKIFRSAIMNPRMRSDAFFTGEREATVLDSWR